MMRSNRGAARVSVVWVIATIVVALVAIAFAVISQQDLTAANTAARDASNASTEAERRFEEEATHSRAVSRAFGFYDRAAAAPRTNPTAASQGFAELRSVFTQMDASIADFEQALPIIRREYESRGQTIAELTSRVRQLESELATERQGRQADVRAKDSTIADLRSQLADEQRNAADREAELQTRLTSAMSQVSALDQDIRRLNQEATRTQRDHGLEVARLGARLDENSRKLNFMSPERRDEPDGRILAVSSMLNSAWIDLGAEHRVARGMRFRVESAGDRNRRVKGHAEVVEVQQGRSRVTLYDLADTFDPVAAGDVVINPLYDPRGERNAVLIGRFTGQYDEARVRQMLQRIGVNVQQNLDISTDFLIVGSEIHVDEFGEPLEEPLQPSEMPVYKQAQADGVQIIPISRIREYFVL